MIQNPRFDNLFILNETMLFLKVNVIHIIVSTLSDQGLSKDPYDYQ